MIKILLLGNGAREHAIATALMRSEHDVELYAFMNANNPGISLIAKDIHVGDLMDFAALQDFAKEHDVHFAVLGPDDPICAGAADALAEIEIPSVGPTKALAQLEGSKSFTRELLKKYEIEGSPGFLTCTNEDELEDFAERYDEIVVKADGLCGGKGVQVQGDHFETKEEGLEYAKECIVRDGKVVLEEKLVGQEFSLLFFVDGETMVPMPVVQDNKRAFEGDKGPNTGGMGTVSDADQLLPFLNEEDLLGAIQISQEVMQALQEEVEETFCGILFGGFMATRDGVKLIEYNTRFGDPEAMNVLSLLETDFVDVCQAMLTGQLGELDVYFAEKATVCKYLVPEGYPENPVKDVAISLDVDKLPGGVELFFASIDATDEGLMLKGSRAIACVGTGDTIAEAELLAEEATRAVSGPLFHRTDIGTEKLLRQRKEMMERIRGKL